MQFFPSYHLSGASPLPLDVGVSFYGGIQHSPVNGCSAASCTFGVLAGDEHTSFYSDLVQPLKRIIHHSQVGLIPGSQSQFNKILVNQTQQYIKRIIHHDQVDLSQGCKDSLIASINVIYSTLTN